MASGTTEYRMRVAFDHQVFCFQRYGGISRYIVELALRLQEGGLAEVACVAPFHRNALLRSAQASRQGLGRSLYLDAPMTGRLLRLANELARGLAWRGIKADIVHETYYSDTPTGPGRHRVVTVHDMIHERFPRQFQDWHHVTTAKRAAVFRADHVICISNATRAELLDRLPGLESKVSVVHHGVTDFSAYDDREPPMPRFREPYFLYVGDRRGYKNFSTLIQALGRPSLRASGVRLLAFGGGRLRAEERRVIASLGLSQRIDQVTGPDRLLASLYRDAVALVFPSMAEGFGMPPLEAMTARCPVTCSRIPVATEVVAGAGEYFDPSDADSIAVAMERILYDNARRAELVTLGSQRASGFSWAACAERTASIYRRLH
jgi:glycosyltransferase involved in cell wall biosynthesis